MWVSYDDRFSRLFKRREPLTQVEAKSKVFTINGEVRMKSIGQVDIPDFATSSSTQGSIGKAVAISSPGSWSIVTDGEVSWFNREVAALNGPDEFSRGEASDGENTSKSKAQHSKVGSGEEHRVGEKECVWRAKSECPRVNYTRGQEALLQAARTTPVCRWSLPLSLRFLIEVP